MHVPTPGEEGLPSTFNFRGIKVPREAVRNLCVSPPITSYQMTIMDNLTGAIEAQVIIAQRIKSDNIGDRQVLQHAVAMFSLVFSASKTYLFERKTLEVLAVLSGAT